MDIVHIKFPEARVDERPLPKGTYCPPRPLDGLPEHEVSPADAHERDKKLARKIALWTLGCVIGYALAYFAHGVFG
jgi:hypothetical protein